MSALLTQSHHTNKKTENGKVILTYTKWKMKLDTLYTVLNWRKCWVQAFISCGCKCDL